ncbi:MAG: AmmeMemoRadiSam system protein B [Proteobacteria bacterium]|nr:AmmeMemoRadiSam system protein B [Pseudomonadota bacterium]
MPEKVRLPVLSGRWYPGEPERLRGDVERMMAAEGPALPRPSCIVVPHAGYVWSGETAGLVYGHVRERGYRRVFVLCPNHRRPVRGIVADEAAAFRTPLGDVSVDCGVIEAWRRASDIGFDRLAHRDEHAIEIQLPFLQVALGLDFRLVPLIVGDISAEAARAFGGVLRGACGADDLVVISADLMHYGAGYGFVPFDAPDAGKIAAYDEVTMAAIASLDAAAFESFSRRHPHASCGLAPLRVMAHAFGDGKHRAVRLAYDTSGRRSGSYDMSVSYFGMAIVPASE